jgi:hypothetical protein
VKAKARPGGKPSLGTIRPAGGDRTVITTVGTLALVSVSVKLKIGDIQAWVHARILDRPFGLAPVSLRW